MIKLPFFEKKKCSYLNNNSLPVWRYTNADLKISLYVRFHKKMIPWKFPTLNLKNSQVIFRKDCKMFVYKHTETIKYVKK